MKKGQKKRIWIPKQKLEIVHKHLEEHIAICTLKKEYQLLIRSDLLCAASGQ